MQGLPISSDLFISSPPTFFGHHVLLTLQKLGIEFPSNKNGDYGTDIPVETVQPVIKIDHLPE